jgi:hypothetical protein
LCCFRHTLNSKSQLYRSKQHWSQTSVFFHTHFRLYRPFPKDDTPHEIKNPGDNDGVPAKRRKTSHPNDIFSKSICNYCQFIITHFI